MTSFSPRGPILRHRTKGMYFGIMDWMPGGLYFLRSYFSACFQSAAFTFSHSESFIVKHRSICFGYFVKMYLSFLEIPYTTLNKCFKVHISTLRRNVLLLLGGKKACKSLTCRRVLEATTRPFLRIECQFSMWEPLKHRRGEGKGKSRKSMICTAGLKS